MGDFLKIFGGSDSGVLGGTAENNGGDVFFLDDGFQGISETAVTEGFFGRDADFFGPVLGHC